MEGCSNRVGKGPSSKSSLASSTLFFILRRSVLCSACFLYKRMSFFQRNKKSNQQQPQQQQPRPFQPSHPPVNLPYGGAPIHGSAGYNSSAPRGFHRPEQPLGGDRPGAHSFTAAASTLHGGFGGPAQHGYGQHAVPPSYHQPYGAPTLPAGATARPPGTYLPVAGGGQSQPFPSSSQPYAPQYQTGYEKPAHFQGHGQQYARDPPLGYGGRQSLEQQKHGVGGSGAMVGNGMGGGGVGNLVHRPVPFPSHATSSYVDQAQKWSLAKEEATTTSSSSSSSSSGKELAFINDLCSSKGTSAFPPRDTMSKFQRSFKGLDHEHICTLLNDKLTSRVWQVRAKALSVLESVLQTHVETEAYIMYFLECRALLESLGRDERTHVSSRASKVMDLLKEAAMDEKRPSVADPNGFDLIPQVNAAQNEFADVDSTRRSTSDSLQTNVDGCAPNPSQSSSSTPTPLNVSFLTNLTAQDVIMPPAPPATVKDMFAAAPALPPNFSFTGMKQMSASSNTSFSSPNLSSSEMEPTSKEQMLDKIHDAFADLSLDKPGATDDKHMLAASTRSSHFLYEDGHANANANALDLLMTSIPREINIEVDVPPGPLGIILDANIPSMAVIERFVPIPNSSSQGSSMRGLLELHPMLCPGAALMSINGEDLSASNLLEIGEKLRETSHDLNRTLVFRKITVSGIVVHPATRNTPYVPLPALVASQEEKQGSSGHSTSSVTSTLTSSSSRTNAATCNEKAAAAAAAALNSDLDSNSNEAIKHRTALKQYDEQLKIMELKVLDIEKAAAASVSSRGDVYSFKDALAQLNGDVERLLYSGIDAVVVGPEVTSSSSSSTLATHVKSMRSALVQRAKRLLKQIHELTLLSLPSSSTQEGQESSNIPRATSSPLKVIESSSFEFLKAAPQAPDSPISTGFSFLSSSTNNNNNNNVRLSSNTLECHSVDALHASALHANTSFASSSAFGFLSPEPFELPNKNVMPSQVKDDQVKSKEGEEKLRTPRSPDINTISSGFSFMAPEKVSMESFKDVTTSPTAKEPSAFSFM